jgi:hypothetical protein
MWGAIISSGSSGGGSADYPFNPAFAKTRHFRVTSAKTIPEGAMIVNAVNRSLQDAVVQVGTGPTELIGPGMAYNYVAQQNTINKTMELSKAITLEAFNGGDLEVFVAYPASSSVNPDTI